MRLFYSLCFFTVFSCCSVGQTIGDIFKTMPELLLPGATEETRNMLLADTSKTTIPYQFGKIERLDYAGSYLYIKTSDIGTTQIKLLPLINNSKIICVIKTVCELICDSQISFYTTDWEELDKTSLLPQISAESFFDSAKKDEDNYKFALSLPDISPISAQFVNGGEDLRFTFDYASYLSREMAQEIKPYLKSDVIVMKWNKARFQ